jgi:hypothetical protein
VNRRIVFQWSSVTSDFGVHPNYILGVAEKPEWQIPQ